MATSILRTVSTRRKGHMAFRGVLKPGRWSGNRVATGSRPVVMDHFHSLLTDDDPRVRLAEAKPVTTRLGGSAARGQVPNIPWLRRLSPPLYCCWHCMIAVHMARGWIAQQNDGCDVRHNYYMYLPNI